MSTDASWALSRSFQAGTVLFEEGDPGSRMYVIRTGKVRIYRKVGSSEIVLAFLGPGDFFGEMALLEQLPRSAFAQVVEDTELIEVDAATFEEMVKRNSTIAMRIMRKLASRVRDLDQRLENMLLDSALGRALEVLRWLVSQGSEEGDWVRLSQSASQIDIGAQAGVPQGQAGTLQRQLVQARLIRWEDGCLHIANKQTLDRFGTYLALKQHYETAEATTLPVEAHVSEHKEMQNAMKRLFGALRLTREDFSENHQALSEQYQRFVELQAQFRQSEAQESGHE